MPETGEKAKKVFEREPASVELAPSYSRSLTIRLVEVADSCSSIDVCSPWRKSHAVAMGSVQGNAEMEVSQSTGNLETVPEHTGRGESMESLEDHKMEMAVPKTVAEADTVCLAGYRM